jgi:hypothetical protein
MDSLVTIRGRFSTFCLLSGMILLLICFQAVQASTINAYKIDCQKSVSEGEKLHHNKYPAMINAISDGNGGPEGVR